MNASRKKRSLPLRILRAAGAVLLCAVILLVGFVGFLSVTEYRPKARQTLDVLDNPSMRPKTGSQLTVVTWNIGYAALGDNADFFMDGGEMVHTADKERIQKNLDDIVSQLRSTQPDVVLLQEVDRKSARSCRVNAFSQIADSLKGFGASFANNFKVAFLPYRQGRFRRRHIFGIFRDRRRTRPTADPVLVADAHGQPETLSARVAHPDRRQRT